MAEQVWSGGIDELSRTVPEDERRAAARGVPSAYDVQFTWDYAKGEQVRTIPAHGKQITCLQFVGKTPEFATCSADQTIRFWRADNGGNTRNLGAPGDYLHALAVSPDGTVVAAGGQRGVVRLYKNNAPFKTLTPPGVSTAKKK